MNELLTKAFEKVQALPAEMQDEAARMLLLYTGDAEATIELTSEEEADFIEALAEASRGEFASDVEVETVLSKYRC